MTENESMFVSREREKLIHAALFFVKNTKYCYKMKLYKLLHFLDFEHFRQTGKSVTGLGYQAWPQGPVPGKFDREISKRPRADLTEAIDIVTNISTETKQVYRVEFSPKIDFNTKLFSKRELRIMQFLASTFHEVKAEAMSQASHDEGLAWRKVFGSGEGNGKPIPYDLALSSTPLTEEETIEFEEVEYRREATRGAGVR